METQFVSLAIGERVCFRAAGTGAIPIVFLHGYTFSSKAWERVLQSLPSAYRGYAIDLRGFGQSDKRDSGYDFAAMADFVAGFMDAVSIGAAIIVGHSYGGMIAQQFALSHQDRVRALVFSDCMAMNARPIGIIPRIQAQIDAYDSREATRAIFEAATQRFFDAANVTRDDLKEFIAVNMQAGVAALKQAVAHVFAYDIVPSERYAAIARPALIVLGSHDIIDWKAAVTLNDAIPSSEIFIVEQAGHTPMWERPKRWSQGVFDFLSRRLPDRP